MKDRKAAISDPRRFQLIDQVRFGEIRPEYAEKEAARLGLVPIEYRPDPADFDPMKERFWTLPMAAAWIAYRTADAVRENWFLYRAQCLEWKFIDQLKGPGRSGYDLFEIPRASLRRLQMTAKPEQSRGLKNSHFPMPVVDAIDALWQALSESRFEASGIEPASGKRASIKALDIQDLELGDVDHHDLLRAKAPIGVGSVCYTQITVPLIGVRSLWDDQPTASSKPKVVGRPPKYDWQIIGDHAVSILDQHGGIDPSDDVLPSQAALERLVLAFCLTELHIQPSESVLREHIPEWISRYEKQRAGN